MKYGICDLAIVPIRAESSDRSEIVSQLLYGDTFEILEVQKQWRRIRCTFDNYEGWIDEKQFLEISETEFQKIEAEPTVLNGDLIDYLITAEDELLAIPLGSVVSGLYHSKLNPKGYVFEGMKVCGQHPKESIVKTAFLYLNAPYLWGGKSPFGIDCSGFTQMVYKLNGYKLLRDASQQATQGEGLSFIEESEPGDLAFFDNEEGKIIHVGIIMKDNYIIHASGKVRVDRLDHLGIYNAELRKHTHKLRVIKKIF